MSDCLLAAVVRYRDGLHRLAFADTTAAMAEQKSTDRHHVIDYIEITVRDMAAAKAFYTAAFGWQFKDYGPGYSGIQGVEREMGGLAQGDEVTTGGPLVILYSEDLDATLAAVRLAGGAITTEPFDFPGGRRFHFTDPSGNQLAVWTQVSAS